MPRPIVVYTDWLDSLPDSQPATMLAYRIQMSVPIWPAMTMSDVKALPKLRPWVVELLRDAIYDLDFFAEVAVVGGLALVTDLHLQDHETEDPEEWLAYHQRAIATGIDELMSLSREAILRKPAIDAAYVVLGESWRRLRATELTLNAVHHRMHEAERESLAAMSDRMGGSPAKDRVARAMRGEPEEN